VDDIRCDMCGSAELALLGQLGLITWLRCRHCGWEQEAPDNERPSGLLLLEDNTASWHLFETSDDTE